MQRRLALLLLLLCQAVMLVYSGFVHSGVYNEEGHVASGLTHIRAGDFSAFSVNPPLARMVGALPLVALDIKHFQPYSAGRILLPRSEYEAGRRLVEESAERWPTYLWLARLSCMVFAFAGSVICYYWAARCYGSLAGFIAAVLWATCPYVLGHGCLVGSDVPAAATGAAAVFCFWRWLKTPRWSEAIMAGVVLGLAELCKFTLLVFYPLLPVLWLVYRLPERKTMARRDWLGQGGMLAAAMFLSVYVINCGYLFEGTFTPLGDFRFQTTLFTGCDSLEGVPLEGANRFAGTWLGKLPVPMPANMLQGIDTQRLDFERGLPSYLRGEWADHGWWYYYLYALAIKMPLGTWCLAAMAVGVTIFRRGYALSWRDEMIVLAPLFTIVIVVSSQTGFSVHSRYIIPALPFLFVWTSKVASVFETPTKSLFAKTQNPEQALVQRRRGSQFRFSFASLCLGVTPFSLRGTVVLMLAWSAGSSLWYYPHSLSYFNELVGGPMGGPRHLLDSNIDWGQDLFYLKDWLAKHPDIKLDGLAYWGSYPGTLAGVPQTPMPPADSESKGRDSDCSNIPKVFQPGWYALSVNSTYSRDRQYRYFVNFQPVATAGYSIYIYHITPDEANRVRKELGLPKLKETCESEKIHVTRREDNL